MKNLTDSPSSAKTPVAGVDSGEIRVLVADDSPLLREGIKSVIQREPGLLLCGFADSHGQVLDAIAKLKPQVVLIAFGLNTTATLALIRETRARYDRTPLLVLSFEDDPVLAKQLSGSGVQAFIARTDTVGCLVEAIHRLVRGLKDVGVKAGQTMAGQMFAAASQRVASNSTYFTGREQEILELIGGGLTSREIAESLRLSVKTVESHRHNIKQKLGVKTAARLAQYAFQWLHSRKLHQS